MARRNLFQPPPPPSEPAADRSRFPNTGAMSGVRSTLRDLSSNAIREIDPALIDDDGPKDRLAFDDADIESLAASIRDHGQQVPIMVRPMADQPNRYRVVYGRRRLRALKLLGQPAKALVRNLSDVQSLIAQGQENSQRLDPSFIEKALFATALADAGHDSPMIMDALAIDKPMLSRMHKVARVVPLSVIEAIGPAHGVGRRRWEDLANALRESDLDAVSLLDGLSLDPASSDTRFGEFATAVEAALRATPPAPRQAPAIEVKANAAQVTLRVDMAQEPDLAQWLRDNPETAIAGLKALWQASGQ